MILSDTDIISVGLVVATLGLVGATIYYAIQTKRLVQVSDRTRTEQVKPVIKTFLSFIGPVYVILRIQNIGLGAAIDFDATLDLTPKSKTFPRNWKEPVLDKGKYRDFFLPDGYLEKIGIYVDHITAKGTYKDVFGTMQEFDEKINVKEFCDMVKNAQVRYEESLEDHVKDIAENTKSIQNQIGKVAEKIEEIKEKENSTK
jgi:hypothetical protein